MSQSLYKNFIAKIIIKKNKIFAEPLFPGTPFKKPVKIENSGYKKGSIVSISLNESRKIGNISKLAGPENKLSEIFKIMSAFHINPCFPLPCLDEVEKILNNPGLNETGLADLTDLPFVTIDNENSRDLDQAINISKSGDQYTVNYALADASFYVKPGSALFEEAVKRGSSFYLPDFSVPMLPRELSEGIISLNPDVDRRAMVFIIKVDGSGKTISTEIRQCKIRSRAKLSYNGVQKYYDKTEKFLDGRDFTENLDLLKEVGTLLIEETKKRGVVQYHRFEEKISIDFKNSKFIISIDKRNDCSRYNEQISLLCNIEGAKIISGDPDVQAIFRVHDSPTNESMERLKTIIHEIVNEHGLNKGQWLWNSSDESLAEYLERIYSLNNEKGVCTAIERQILISNERSIFTDHESNHYALGVDLYSRFSSPMREIIGIFIHKETYEKLGFVKSILPSAKDEEYREVIIKSGNRSKEIQKKLGKAVKKLVVDQIFSKELTKRPADKKIYSGIILGIKSSRLYVRLDEHFLEIKVYISEIEEYAGTKLNYEKESVFIQSQNSRIKYSIGKSIKLKVISYNEKKSKWILLPVSIL